MKKILSTILVFVLVFSCVLSFASCGKTPNNEPNDNPGDEPQDETPTISYSYTCRTQDGTNEDTTQNTYYNGLLQLWSDGSLKFYIASHKGDVYSSYTYTGTWSITDDLLDFTYAVGESEFGGSEVEVVDGVFEVRGLSFGGTVLSTRTVFNIGASIELEGDTYIGYLRKTLSMGDFVYSYVLNLKEDGTFTLSNNMKTPFGAAINGIETGTYTIEDGKLKVVYDVVTDSDEDGTMDSVLVANQEAEFDFTTARTSFSAGFYIGQSTNSPSLAEFIYLAK